MLNGPPVAPPNRVLIIVIGRAVVKASAGLVGVGDHFHIRSTHDARSSRCGAARPRPMSRWILAFMASISTSGGIGIRSVVGLRVKIAQIHTPAYAIRGRADPNRFGAASRTAVTCTATGTAAGRRRP